MLCGQLGILDLASVVCVRACDCGDFTYWSIRDLESAVCVCMVYHILGIDVVINGCIHVVVTPSIICFYLIKCIKHQISF